MSLNWNQFRSRFAGQGCNAKGFSSLYSLYKRGENIDELRCDQTRRARPSSPKKSPRRKSSPRRKRSPVQRSDLPSFASLKEIYESTDDFEVKISEWTIVGDAAITFEKSDGEYSALITGETAGTRDPRHIPSDLIDKVKYAFPATTNEILLGKKNWENLMKKALSARSRHGKISALLVRPESRFL